MIGLGLAVAVPRCQAASTVQVERLPTIVTYELSKARRDAHRAAHDPKTFWVSEIVTRIEDKKPAAREAIKKPITVDVGFVVDKDGHVVSKQVAHSSGNAVIDKEALAVLDRAAPFPPMPPGMSDDHLAFTVPLRFK